MLPLEQILEIDGPGGFEAAAIEIFRYQATHCAPYRAYMDFSGTATSVISSVADIPFLPIELFKSTDVYSGERPPEITFTSSTTGGGKPSRHHMASVGDYEKTFIKAFSLFYGDPAAMGIYALLPGYLEREGSSLVYMADKLIGLGRGGFYLNYTGKLVDDISKDTGKKLLLGVTYSLLDLAEKCPDLSGTIVMETGGMKGKREELVKAELHGILCRAFNVPEIHSEYGMAELSSQAYSDGGGIFRCPPWMKVMVRDLNDPFDIRTIGSGGINIIDLANRCSCAFIQTQDIGTVHADGSFSITGRIDRSETRGCNLLVQ